jgi:tight adherence protein C
MTPTLALAVGAIAAAVVLVVHQLLTSASDRSEVRSVLRSLDQAAPADLRQQELMIPLSQRVLVPLGKHTLGVTRRLMPAGYMENVRRRLIIAGRPAVDEIDRFRALRVLTVVASPFVFGLAYFALRPAGSRVQLAVAVFLALAVVVYPDVVLSRQTAERQHAIRVQLPDILDLLTISVEAGLGFEQALDRTVATVPGPLSEEFRRMLGELRAGAGRGDALRHLDHRTQVSELHSFVLALIQADTFGVSIGRALRAQSEEMRVKRHQLAQEEAQKAPVKLMFPTVFCILPALFVVVIGPAVINIARSLG